MSPKDYQSSRQTHYKGSALLQIIRRVTTVEKREIQELEFSNNVSSDSNVFVTVCNWKTHQNVTTALSLLDIAQVIYVVNDLW